MFIHAAQSIYKKSLAYSLREIEYDVYTKNHGERKWCSDLIIILTDHVSNTAEQAVVDQVCLPLVAITN